MIPFGQRGVYSMSQQKVLSVPEVKPIKFKRNYIDIAVCELRFPTLLELESKPPLNLHKHLRKKYPGYEKLELLNNGNNEGVPGRFRYLFKSRNGDWTITIHAGALSLETRNYTEFSDFCSRLSELLDLSKSLIDSDFFTRIGLRYINKIPIKDGVLSGWINDELISQIISGPYGEISKHVTEIRGKTKSGEYMFRQAMSIKDGQIDAYILDYDYSKEDVEFENALQLISDFNKENFSFFHWCLGEKAKDYLEKKNTT